MDGLGYDEFGFLDELRAELGITDPRLPVRRGDIAVDGLRHISVLAWGAGPADVVALHGMGQNAHTFDAVALALHRPFLALDLPGHGHADGPGTTAPTIADLSGDIERALDAVLGQPVILLGMSLGGLVAIQVAARRPDLVRSVVLLDITPGVKTERAEAITSFIDGPSSFGSLEEMINRAQSFSPHRSPASLAHGVRHNARQREDGRWIWHHQRHNARLSPTRDASALWSALAGIEGPVTLVRGGQLGSVVTAADVELFHTLRPNDEVNVAAKAGHAIQSDDPWAVVAAVSRALARQHTVTLAGEGSNLQPTEPKSVVLPIELPATGRVRIFRDS